ncbi:MAG: DNA polymerase III subunit gamma/tau [Bacteroidetes bacterium]|nr:DNA polymerase III subunit gamma/tau [Bacteroidota bacterium]
MAENYIVSARKYRPQTFDTVIGQEHITTTLKNAIRHQHLAHAYLFCGPRGVGKTTCARILAKTINCEHPSAEMEACNECSSCLSFKNNASFNIFELDAASNNSVEDIRELVNQVRFAPQQGKYKIYIIDEVHMLSSQAFNAFLKTLEEPPSYAIFILATTEKHKILPTILSRCQIFDFKRITTQHIVDHLQGIATKEGMIAQEAALHVIAQKSEGCMRDALSMLDRIAGFTNGQLSYAATMEHLNMLDADFYFQLGDCLLSQDVSGTLLALDHVLERGFEGNVIIEGLAEHFRNLLLCKDQRMVRLLEVPNDHKPIYLEKASQAPPSFIISALNVLNEAELNYKSASNKRLHIEMCLIRLCYILQATSAQIEKKKPDDIAGKQSTPTNRVAEMPAPSSPASHQVSNQPPEPKQEVVNIVSEPPSTLPKARRVQKSLLDEIDVPINTSQLNEEEKKTVTIKIVEDAFEIYKRQLKEEGKTMYYAQFSSMSVELVSEDEIRLVAPSDLSEEYAKEQRNQLIDFFREKTGVLVRVTTEVRLDETNIQAQPKVLSKSDLLQEMMDENPALASLKEQLNLNIEY